MTMTAKTSQSLTVLVVGASGSIGRLVVEEALNQGHRVRALVRAAPRGRPLPPQAQVVLGDITRPETLAGALDGVDAVVFTHGSNGDKSATESVDYGAVRNVLTVLGAQPARIALMTAIGVTNRTGSYNRRTEAHDWKRRSERLVRASRRPYTIVRPGWFDYNQPAQQALLLLQGDTRQAGDLSDGVIARRQIAQVLVASLTSEAALNKTFELVATEGPAPSDLDSLLAALTPDRAGALDGVRDADNMPLGDEPKRVTEALRGEQARAGA
jgi:uncharacterized protein YbjT (DUF2867 family)